MNRTHFWHTRNSSIHVSLVLRFLRIRNGMAKKMGTGVIFTHRCFWGRVYHAMQGCCWPDWKLQDVVNDGHCPVKFLVVFSCPKESHLEAQFQSLRTQDTCNIYIYKYKLLWISILRLRYFQEISMGYIYIFSWDFRWVSPQFQLTLCQDSPPTDGIATSPSEVTNAWIPHCCISMIPPRKMNVAS